MNVTLSSTLPKLGTVFIIHTKLHAIADSQRLSLDLFADDTQLSAVFRVTDTGNAKSIFDKCTISKTEFLIIVSFQVEAKLNKTSIPV